MPRTKYNKKGSNEKIGHLDYKIEVNPDRVFRLNLIYVEETYRRLGYGKGIMEDVIKNAKSFGCKKIILSVKDLEYNVFSNYQVRKNFFEKFGFQFDEHGFGVLNLI
jgi:GNAT superfamily N-acetyltransferase